MNAPKRINVQIGTNKVGDVLSYEVVNKVLVDLVGASLPSSITNSQLGADSLLL